MATVVFLDDLESYVAQYGVHGGILRLQFIAETATDRTCKVEAYKLCLDLLKRTTNTRSYFEVHAALKDQMEAEETHAPNFDAVWAEATAKQATILKDVYEQDLQQAKTSQIRESIRNCYVQLAAFATEQGDYATALRNTSKSREFCSDPRTVFTTCMSIIKLNVLLRQYADIQTFANKAQHTPFKEEFPADQSKLAAAHGLYHLTNGKYKEAALAFVQVKPQDLSCAANFNFSDVLCAQDVAVYGVLSALASLDRSEVQTRLLGSANFRECLDLVPQLRDLCLDFCSCRYAACLATLASMRNAWELDIHLSSKVADILQQIRSKSMVQYFAPFLSVSLHSMAQAFNTDVDGIQAEVAELVGKRQLDAKIDSQRKILHVRHANQRKVTYQNAMRVSEDFLDTTQALLLRMNLLKRDFGVYVARQKK